MHLPSSVRRSDDPIIDNEGSIAYVAESVILLFNTFHVTFLQTVNHMTLAKGYKKKIENNYDENVKKKS